MVDIQFPVTVKTVSPCAKCVGFIIGSTLNSVYTDGRFYSHTSICDDYIITRICRGLRSMYVYLLTTRLRKSKYMTKDNLRTNNTKRKGYTRRLCTFEYLGYPPMSQDIHVLKQRKKLRAYFTKEWAFVVVYHYKSSFAIWSLLPTFNLKRLLCKLSKGYLTGIFELFWFLTYSISKITMTNTSRVKCHHCNYYSFIYFTYIRLMFLEEPQLPDKKQVLNQIDWRINYMPQCMII